MSSELLPGFETQSRAGEVYVVHIIFFVLSVITVLARLAAARTSRRDLELDDWLALAAVVFIMGLFIGTMLFLRFGLGRHEVVVEKEDHLNITRYFQTMFANEILYPLGLGCARLSLAVLYYRIFGLFSARYYLYGVIAFIVAWTIYASVPTIVACTPVEDFWKIRKNCIDLARLYISTAVGSIVTDFTLIILPIRYTLGLEMSYNQKALLVLVFVFGGLSHMGNCRSDDLDRLGGLLRGHLLLPTNSSSRISQKPL
ncbi:integral membrane protein [Colletotrichum incanum]|uniref:Integral membrane protein n=1 Tax=Colletotrichum incanum TaxID=1573173 RepID=A0A166Q3Y3_COLIC|nr:integral membrane protein [Colletotrichum incanum]